MAKYYVGSAGFGENELYHFGVKGMRWGIRRYQNEDGTLTAEGRAKYQAKYDRAQARSDAFKVHYALEGGKQSDKYESSKAYKRSYNRADFSENVRSRLRATMLVCAPIGVGVATSSLSRKIGHSAASSVLKGVAAGFATSAFMIPSALVDAANRQDRLDREANKWKKRYGGA